LNEYIFAKRPEFRVSEECEAKAVNTTLRGGFWTVGGPQAWVQGSCQITVGGKTKTPDAHNEYQIKESGSNKRFYAYTNS
jgi:hypothetical protein